MNYYKAHPESVIPPPSFGMIIIEDNNETNHTLCAGNIFYPARDLWTFTADSPRDTVYSGGTPYPHTGMHNDQETNDCNKEKILAYL